MLCGMKWYAFISRNNAYRICKKCRLKVSTDFNTKREERIADEPKSWIKKGRYNHLTIEVRKNAEGYTLKVRGSLHKFYHSGDNSGNFTGVQVLGALQGLCDLFEVEPSNIIVQNLEVGINLPVWFYVQEYLDLNLIYHKKRTTEEGDLKGIGFYFKHDDYWVKLYQKGKHLLRYEIAYKSKLKLEGFGVSTLADLNEKTINVLADSLLPEWVEVLMRDGIDTFDKKGNPHNLNEKERDMLADFSSSFYQQGYEEHLKAACKRKKAALRQQAHRLRTASMHLIKSRGNKHHARLQEMILSGIEEFKKSWGQQTMSRFPPSIRQGKRDKIENIELNTNNCNNTNTKMDTTTSQVTTSVKLIHSVPLKSKKQIAKENREAKEKQFQSFLSALGVTLQKVQKEPAY